MATRNDFTSTELETLGDLVEDSLHNWEEIVKRTGGLVTAQAVAKDILKDRIKLRAKIDLHIAELR